MRYLVTAYNENDRPYCGSGFARNFTIEARQYRRTRAYKDMTRDGVAELWGVAYWLIRPWPHGTYRAGKAIRAAAPPFDR